MSRDIISPATQFLHVCYLHVNSELLATQRKEVEGREDGGRRGGEGARDLKGGERAVGTGGSMVLHVPLSSHVR